MNFRISVLILLTLGLASVNAQESIPQSDREVLFPNPALDLNYAKLQKLADKYYEKGQYKKAYKVYSEDLTLLGDKFAQFRAGYMHFTGEGVAKDPVAAYAWMRLAAERGSQQLTTAAGQVWDQLDAEQRTQAKSQFKQLQSQYGDRVLLARLIEEDERTLKTTTGSRLGQTNAQSRVYNPNVRGSVTDAEGFTKALRQRIEARTRYIELLDGNIEYSEFEVIEDQPTNTAATQPDAN